MFLKIVNSPNDEPISGNDYYNEMMLVGKHLTYCTFKVQRHPCTVKNMKEYVFRKWGANTNRQKVVRKVDNDTLEETSDDDVLLDGSKYMIIHIAEEHTSTVKFDMEADL